MNEETPENSVKVVTAADIYGQKPEKPALEEKPESEKEENSEAQDDAEVETEDEKPEAAAESDEEGKPKKDSGFKKRIKKLNAKLSDKDREIDYLKKQLFQGEKPQASETEKPVESKKPRQDDFDTYEDYQDARDEWLVAKTREEARKELESKEAEKSQKSKIESFQQKLTAFKDEHSDFDDVMEDIEGVLFSDAVKAAMTDSENGPALIYELARDPKEFERICKLPDHIALKEIGKIEARLEKPNAKVAKEKTTKAPPPPTPLNGKSEKATKKSLYDEGLTQSEFEELMSSQSKRKWGA